MVEQFEGEVILEIRELDIGQRINLVGVTPKQLEEYLSKKRESHRELALKILSTSWKDRETDTCFTLKDFEFEDMGCKTFLEIKNLIKKDRLTITELDIIINHFTSDDSCWYSPTGIKGYN